MKEFAERLYMFRKEKGMTQNEVAEALGVSFQTVSMWERGETSPDINRLSDLADLLGVTADRLLTGKAEPKKQPDFYGAPSEKLFDEKRMYIYIKTYVTAAGLYQTAKVLPYARKMHEGQFRKGKEKVPYIYHTLLVTCHALALGLTGDNLLSAALLHDVCEDCGVAPEDLPVNDETKEIVRLLTKDADFKKSGEAGKKKYYGDIAENEKAALVKLLDRCCNLSEMASAFSPEKMKKYIDETEKYLYPLFDIVKNRHPRLSNQIFLLRYQITSIIETIKNLQSRSLD